MIETLNAVCVCNVLKLIGAGLSVLDGIDPNPDNFVCAGIIHTSSHQIGCLVRLEPNKQALVSTDMWLCKFIHSDS